MYYWSDYLQSDHDYCNKKKRKMVQTSKKKECVAKICLKEVITFPEFKVNLEKCNMYNNMMDESQNMSKIVLHCGDYFINV